MEVPFLTYQQFSNLIGSVVPMIIKEQNWQPMIDTIWAIRDETDYDFRNDLVKKEFMRKWSHSRTSVGAMLSLDQLMEDAPDKSSGKRRQHIHIQYDGLGFIPLNELLTSEKA